MSVLTANMSFSVFRVVLVLARISFEGCCGGPRPPAPLECKQTDLDFPEERLTTPLIKVLLDLFALSDGGLSGGRRSFSPWWEGPWLYFSRGQQGSLRVLAVHAAFPRLHR